MAEDATTILSKAPHLTGERKQEEKWWQGSALFGLAGASNMCGSFITNPVNVVKVRMQLDGALSSTQALGGDDPAHTPLWIKVSAGSAAGIVGSAVANPTDVVIVRMQASSHGRGVMGEWRYSGPFHALASIVKNEGIRGLYRGISPTIQRAGILNAAQTPSYDHAKHILLNAGILKEGVPCHLVSSMIAGFVTAIVISPIDLIKTRIMQQPVDVDGKGTIYSSSFDCFKKTIRSEGMLSLYKGFVPVWMRIFPHTIVTFFIFEQLRKALGIAPV